MRRMLWMLLCLGLVACGDEQVPAAAPPPLAPATQGQYDQGYAWALSEQIEDPDECDDGEADQEFVDGCRTWVTQRLQMLAMQESQESMGVQQFEPAPSGPSDFDLGFAWAQQQDVNKAEVCKKQRGTRDYREGCAAYVKNRLGVNPNE